jgi:hypothetical protein
MHGSFFVVRTTANVNRSLEQNVENSYRMEGRGMVAFISKRTQEV